MTRYHTIAALAMFLASSSVEGFTPAAHMQRATAVTLSATTQPLPYFLQDEQVGELQAPAEERKLAKKPAPKKKNSAHKEGIFSPVVNLAKQVLGEEELNRIRGNAISLHSDTIKKFVGTAEGKFGMQVLQALYKMADRNGNGKMEREELEAFLKQSLGFRFLGDKAN